MKRWTPAPPERQKRDLARPARIGDVVDAEPARHPASGLCAGCASRLTSIRPLAARTLCECVPGGTSIPASAPRRLRIAHVDQRRAVRSLHVRDVRDTPVDDHLAAAGAIEVTDLSQPSRACAIARHVRLLEPLRPAGVRAY